MKSGAGISRHVNFQEDQALVTIYRPEFPGTPISRRTRLIAIAPGLHGVVLAAVVAPVAALAMAIPTRDQIRPEQQLEGVVSCSV